MDANEAVATVAEYVRSAGLDYPTVGLVADRFDAGWSVYAPVDVDAGDPMAFLDTPVGRSVFLVGDSGYLEEVSSSVPPDEARRRFAEHERATARTPEVDPESEFLGQVGDALREAGGDAVATGFTLVDGIPRDADAAQRDDRIRAEASALLDPVAQQLAALGPSGWLEYRAEFAFTVRAEFAELRFATADGWQRPVAVPEPIRAQVRQQRRLAAGMSEGPWWRVILGVTNAGVLSVGYDYGDDPFPPGQLQPAQHYRDDIAAYPRAAPPVWLAGYLAGPAAQGRDPDTAQRAAAADAAAGRTPTPTDDVEPLGDTWTRWALLAAAYTGARSEWGPRMARGIAQYESDARSGATLHLLAGGRAVLSGGWWESPLLAAAYHDGQPLPDLYAGAPAWVDDTVLNTRNRNGLLSFCYWWSDGRWWRGATNTFDELDAPLPAIWTPEETVAAMVTVVGPDAEHACGVLLGLAERRAATPDAVAEVFRSFGGADVGAAVNQLAVAGLVG